ncbi:MAG: AI-2E family transporter [Muribaculaceae bacterium]|nr:AI-2E family transporter [Muribaculaceae bacterium]
MPESRPITFDRVIRVLAAIAVIAILVWLINELKDVLLPFGLACLIAYLLEPAVQFQQKLLRTSHRALPVFITLFETTMVLGVMAYFFIPSALGEIDQVDALVKASADKDTSSPFIPPELQEYLRNALRTENIAQLMTGSRLETILNKGTTVLAATVDFLLHTLEWLLTFIYVIFIMLDYNRLMRGFKAMVPPSYRHTIYKVGDDIARNMNIYFRSQAVIAACAAAFYCIGFSIAGLPMAIIMGITVGILYMIPYFQYITLIPVAVLCYIYSLTGEVGFWAELGKCLIVYFVSQCICDYILTPKIMGKTLGLNPAIILLSLSVWGSLMGLVGMIIALPLTALMIAYYNEYVIRQGK